MDEEKNTSQNPIDNKLREAVSNELRAYTDTAAADLMPARAPAPTPEPKTAPIPAALAPHAAQPIVRTYKSDMEEAIQTGHLSSISMAVSENAKLLKNARQGEIEEKKAKINKNILILSIVLVFGGMLALLIPYVLTKQQQVAKTQPTQTISVKALLTPDLEEKININAIDSTRFGAAMKQHIDQSSITLGQVKNLLVVKTGDTGDQAVSANDFLALIQARVPDDIARTLRPEYMFGVHNFNGNQEFLILKVGSYDTAFSGMLAWEQSLWQDFRNLFGLQSTATSTDTTATDEQNFGITIQKFQDATFANKDCRVVRNASGAIVFLYSIIDENTVVIATSVDTLKEIITRLNRAKSVTQ